MSRRWLRYRLRTLVLAVAILAIAMGASVWFERLARLRDQRLQRATWHAERATNEANHAAQYTLLARVAEQEASGDSRKRDYEEQARVHTRRMMYHITMERQFESSADRPWKKAPAELPPPE